MYLHFYLAKTPCFPFSKHCSKPFANIYQPCHLGQGLSEPRFFICKLGTRVACTPDVKGKCDYVCPVLWTGHGVWRRCINEVTILKVVVTILITLIVQ